jgi:hypothetical protein
MRNIMISTVKERVVVYTGGKLYCYKYLEPTCIYPNLYIEHIL